MTEEDAKAWLDERGWWATASGERLRALVELVLRANESQNLISAATTDHVWARHIVDSAQLVPLATFGDVAAAQWVDLGTGAGFPGLVVACLLDIPVMLVEARKLRTQFLESCVAALDLRHVTVAASRVQSVHLSAPATHISARAFAPLERLFADAAHLAGASTQWLLPKGRHAQLELESARRQWQGVFHVEQSVTASDSVILCATGVTARPQPRSARSKAR